MIFGQAAHIGGDALLNRGAAIRGHSRGPYIAAFSSISILYGGFRILQRLSSMSASQK